MKEKLDHMGSIALAAVAMLGGGALLLLIPVLGWILGPIFIVVGVLTFFCAPAMLISPMLTIEGACPYCAHAIVTVKRNKAVTCSICRSRVIVHPGYFCPVGVQPPVENPERPMGHYTAHLEGVAAQGKSTPRQGNRVVGAVLVGLACIMVAMVIYFAFSPSSRGTAKGGHPLLATLSLNCAPQPDEDDSTLYDTPRPPIPTRFLRWHPSQTQAAFVYDHKTGGWQFLAFQDSASKQPISIAQAKARLCQ